ncbi:MAG: class I SAM-dependent methyltransferase [Steroidobacteraceae bacterium]
MCSASTYDSALETLLLPFGSGRLQWPQAGALFLRARAGSALQHTALPGLVCEQSFRPDAEALERAGFTVRAAAGSAETYPLVLVLPPRQRDESRALMARAIASIRPGGIVVASASNNEGARSAEADLTQLAGSVDGMIKNKCRVFWTPPLQGPPNPTLLAEWLALDAVQPIEGGRFMSRPGIFAWDRIDPASQLLADQLPADLHGAAADLGAGFGFLSAKLLERCPKIASVDLYEAEGRALDVAKTNLAGFVSRATLEFKWHDVTSGLPRRYDVIVTNPPFHTQNRVDRPDIGRRFIAVAAASLNPGGSLWMVANRHLPYEEVLADNFARVRKVAEKDGFKIIEAVKGHGR